MRERIARNWPALLLVSVSLGITLAHWVRLPVLVLTVLAVVSGGLALRETEPGRRLALAAVVLVVTGLWWGGL